MKFLICGLGSIGQRHARLLRAALGADARIAAFRARGLDIVINDDLTVIEGADPVAHWGLEAAFPTLEAGLDWGPDAVFVTNPISMHVATALAAVRAGAHVFIEKPLSDHDDGVDELVEEARRRGRIVQVGYQLRFHPALRRLRQHLAEGRLGRVVAADVHFGEYLPTMHPYEDYRDSHMARADQGGGALLCLSHEVDYACWLLGRPRRIAAMGGHLSGLEMSGVEDVASVLLGCEQPDGRIIPAHVHLNFLERPAVRYARIIGDAGSALFEYGACALTLTDTATGQATRADWPDWRRNDMFQAQLDHFLRCIRGEEAPQAPLEEAVAVHRVCLAAVRALRNADGGESL